VRCLYAASEVAGFAKTGGLADVAAALPQALARRGHDCAVILPLYHCARGSGRPLVPTGLTFTVQVGSQAVPGALWRSTLPGSSVPVYLIEQNEYFDRDDPAAGRGLYQFTLADGRRCDYPDNLARFVFFGRAVLEAMPLLDLRPDVLHLHDWHTGLVPVYLKEARRRLPRGPLLTLYQGVGTLFTMHNVAYQGLFPAQDFPVTGLPWRLFNWEQLEFYGHLNCLKAGIIFADRVNTVGPTYAREIQTPIYGQHLQGVLGALQKKLSGILNGVDYRIWDPSADAHLPATFDSSTVRAGKSACKRVLQEHCGLPTSAQAPLLGMVARLVEQKGIDLLVEALPPLLKRGVQVVVLGEGDPRYHTLLRSLQKRFPHQLGLVQAQDERVAHLIYGGADLFLMPSLFEPCGLVQLYALRYGAVPVVRATGGLADTVTDTTAQTLTAGTANGFTFGPPVASLFLAATDRALEMFADRPDDWLGLIRSGMAQDWSWDRSARQYEELYERIVRGKE
jgi:starch synthase